MLLEIQARGNEQVISEPNCFEDELRCRMHSMSTLPIDLMRRRGRQERSVPNILVG